jgi:hypothetical protein
MRYPGFIGGTGEQQSVMAGVSRTINLMPEMVESEPGKNVAVLNGTPGLVLWNTVGAGPIKLIDPTPTNIGGTLYIHVVSGNTLYRVKWTDGSGAVSIGSLATSDDPAIANGFFAMSLVVAGGTAYSLNKSTDTLAAIGAFSGKTMVGAAMLDTFFLTTDTQKVYYSSPSDPTVWDLLDFNTALADTDQILGLATKHGELWIFKERSTEPFYNSGDTLVPFQRIPGASLTIGVGGATQAVAKLDQSFIFMGMDLNGGGIIYQTVNFIPQRISTHAVEKAIRGYANPGGAIAWSFVLRGHYVYVINFPNANATWAYDTNTKQWFEWLSWDGAAFNQHIARCSGVGSDWLVGSRVDGKIYKLRDDAYDEAGLPIKRLRRAPHLCDEKKVFTYSDLELDMESGIGTVASAPTANLRYSNDGGKTWVGPISAAIGETPNTKTRVIWRRLGSARDRVFEVSSTAAIKHCWTDAFINNLG